MILGRTVVEIFSCLVTESDDKGECPQVNSVATMAKKTDSSKEFNISLDYF